jgi:hypothetical protein
MEAVSAAGIERIAVLVCERTEIDRLGRLQRGQAGQRHGGAKLVVGSKFAEPAPRQRAAPRTAPKVCAAANRRCSSCGISLAQAARNRFVTRPNGGPSFNYLWSGLKRLYGHVLARRDRLLAVARVMQKSPTYDPVNPGMPTATPEAT